MAEYIEREALLKWFEPYLGVGETWVEIHPVLDAVYALSTADVAPVVHGRWGPMYWDEAEDDFVRDCSACNNHHSELSLYCPNCGARMDGE